MKGTRILYSQNLNPGKLKALEEQARLLGKVRSEVWQRFGSINGVGINHRTIRSDWVKTRDFSPLPAKAWKETLRDAIDDIRLYEEAAKEKVRKQIHTRFKEKDERKYYFGLLKYNRWVNDPLLCRWMRKAKKHGRNHTHHQIVVENGVYTQFKGKNGDTWLKIPSLVKGQRISIPLNSNVQLKGMLRLILRDGRVEVHYLANGKQHQSCGGELVAIDKGYSEVYVDNDGVVYGKGFNQLLTPASKNRSNKNKARNKLFQLAEKSSPIKKARIYTNNLGTKKRNKQNRRIKAQIRTHCFQATHELVDKASIVIAEDLTFSTQKKNNWKQFNRLMNQWMKGFITEALEKVTTLRGSELHYVNAAYLSQMDSQTHRLEGTRVGDKFYHVSGDITQADENAARNTRHRFLYDTDITLYTSYQKVKEILQSKLRASEELVHLGE